MALLTPPLLLLFIGIVDIGLGIYAWNACNGATRESVKKAADSGDDPAATAIFRTAFNTANHGDETYTTVWIIRFSTDSTGTIITGGLPGHWRGDTTPVITGAGPAVVLTTTEVQPWLDSAGVGNAANLKFVITEVYYEHPTLFGWFGPRVAMRAWTIQRDVTPDPDP